MTDKKRMKHAAHHRRMHGVCSVVSVMIIKQVSTNKHKGMMIPKYIEQTSPVKNCVLLTLNILAVMKFQFPLPEKPFTTSSADDGMQNICNTLQHVFTCFLCEDNSFSLDYKE